MNEDWKSKLVTSLTKNWKSIAAGGIGVTILGRFINKQIKENHRHEEAMADKGFESYTEIGKHGIKSGTKKAANKPDEIK